ncbi:hypothetical protein FRC08_016262 [Ceratobasidium sp. 394]|nr:hypothetical protein FRC08_016262 [Ceratobasidium sp. 394]
MDVQTPFDNDTLMEALLVSSTLLANRSVFINRSDLTESLVKEIHHQLPELRTELFGGATPDRAEHTVLEESGEQRETHGINASGSAGQEYDVHGIPAPSVPRSNRTVAISWEAEPTAKTTLDRVT